MERIGGRWPCAGPEFTGPELASAQLAGPEFARSQRSRKELAGAQLASAQLASSQLAGAQLTDPEHSAAELADPNDADSEIAGPQHTDALTHEFDAACHRVSIHTAHHADADTDPHGFGCARHIAIGNRAARYLAQPDSDRFVEPSYDSVSTRPEFDHHQANDSLSDRRALSSRRRRFQEELESTPHRHDASGS
ncbi:MAG: hypothetical protein KDC95_10910 [Planctomycetes bacterium]|nr:hypothetical protein [Planctomycetota bacterium]